MIGNITYVKSCSELTDLINIRNSFKIPRQPAVKSKVKVIVVDDMNPNQKDYICASILLPNAKAMEYLINGHEAMFRFEYERKLYNDPDIKEYFAVLLTGLMEKSYDYILFFDFVNNYNMPIISDTLMNFLVKTYGLVMVSYEQVKEDPNILFMQCMNNQYFLQNKNLIMEYGYSNSRPKLFMDM